jgi:hypothetical protein
MLCVLRTEIDVNVRLSVRGIPQRINEGEIIFHFDFGIFVIPLEPNFIALVFVLHWGATDLNLSL